MNRDGSEAIQYGSLTPRHTGYKRSPSAVHAKDFVDLLLEASNALYQTLEEGAAKGYDDQWRRIQNAEDHIAHAYAHLYQAKAGAERLMHLRHTLCRTAMALYHETAKGPGSETDGSSCEDSSR